jgi:uncharacterized protein YjbJ (UPF0337 family)
MNRDTLKGDWNQLKGRIKEAWGKLTDQDLEVVAGKRDQLVGLIQKTYGIAREAAEREVQEFERVKHEAAERQVEQFERSK